jgi:formamidopyrimidine-DNA glycosylase
MPELAEVEFYRQRWAVAQGTRIARVHVHPRARIVRSAPAARVRRALAGRVLEHSAAQAKQILLRFSGGVWLGLHLGMSGELAVAAHGYRPGPHDHLVLFTTTQALVCTDPRMFGRVELHRGAAPPPWWTALPPPVLSPAFTAGAVAEFLRQHGRAPVKAVLLMQPRFPGIGNWMADEILWRAAIHPRRPAGSLAPAEVRTLWRETRRVARLALDTIAGRDGRLPPELNLHIPSTWLFAHRWRDGGRCPRTGVPLVRESIGGRTTCWSPGRQLLR